MGSSAPSSMQYFSGANDLNRKYAQSFKDTINSGISPLTGGSGVPDIDLPTSDEWHYLTEDAKRAWNGVMDTDYYQEGNIFPGMKKVTSLHPDYERTQHLLGYSPPGEYGKFVTFPNGGTGYDYYSQHKQLNPSQYSDYYTAQAYAHGANPWVQEWQFDESNPLYQALWNKNDYRDDYFDTQANDQLSQGLANMTSAPLYRYNINTTKMASSGGK